MAAADWPVHPNKEWQKTIDKSYEFGWRKPFWTSAHPKLIMQCPSGNAACTITAFKTGNGTESVAIASRKKIERCLHRVITEPLIKVDEALNAANRLISGAEKLAERNEAVERLRELVDLAGVAVDDAAAELERAFDETDAELTVLGAEVEGLLGETEDASAVGEVADSAKVHLRTARVTLGPLPQRAPEVVRRQERLETLVARRDLLVSDGPT